jgi:hypothetical protein
MCKPQILAIGVELSVLMAGQACFEVGASAMHHSSFGIAASK